jgi:type IV pilus assembly protein PilM
VQLDDAGKGAFKLVAKGMVAIPEKSDTQEKNDLAVIEAIKTVTKEAKVTAKQTVISLPESQVYTRVIEMPYLEEPELSAAIKWQSEQFLPVPVDEVVQRHQVISQPETGTPDAKMQVLLVAAPINLVNARIALVGKAGFEVIGVETEIFAASRSLISPDLTMPTTLLLCMGSEATTFALLSNSDIALVQSIATGGRALTRAISTELGLDATQAEEYKKAYGLDPTKLEGRVQKAIKPLIDIIIEEARRIIAYRATHFSSDPVKRLVVSGGGGLITGLVTYLAETLTVEAQLGDPFVSVTLTDEQKATFGQDRTVYSTAVGLALKLT